MRVESPSASRVVLIPEAHLNTTVLHSCDPMHSFLPIPITFLRCWKTQLSKFRMCLPHGPMNVFVPPCSPPQRTLPPKASAHRLSPVSGSSQQASLLPSGLVLDTHSSCSAVGYGWSACYFTPSHGEGWHRLLTTWSTQKPANSGSNKEEDSDHIPLILISSFYTGGKKRKKLCQSQPPNLLPSQALLLLFVIIARRVERLIGDEIWTFNVMNCLTLNSATCNPGFHCPLLPAKANRKEKSFCHSMLEGTVVQSAHWPLLKS